jgi:hypothetical protein
VARKDRSSGGGTRRNSARAKKFRREAAHNAYTLLVDRREFLGASTAAIALGASAAPYTPRFERIEDGWQLRYGDDVWPVVRSVFAKSSAGSATINCRQDEKKLSLSNAVYPGSDFVADFNSELIQVGADWFIDIAFAVGKKQQRISLIEWMRSAKDGSGAPPYSDSWDDRNGNSISIGKPNRTPLKWPARGTPIRIFFRADFSAVLEAPPDRPFIFKASVQAPKKGFDETGVERIGIAKPTLAQRTTFTFGNKTSPKRLAVTLGTIGNGAMGAFAEFYDCVIQASAYVVKGSQTVNDRNTADISVVGAEAAFVVRSGGAGADGARIQLVEDKVGKVRVDFGQTLEWRSLQISGAVSAHPFGIETDSFAIVVCGQNGQRFGQTFTDLPIQQLVVPVVLQSAHVPIDGGATTDLYLEPLSGRILFKPNAGVLRGQLHDTRDAIAWIGGAASGLELPLEPAAVRVSRAADLFDLTFRFKHHALSVNGGVTTVRKRWSTVDGCMPKHGSNCAPQVTVQFPPQHVFEQAYQPPTPVGMPGTDTSAAHSYPEDPRSPIQPPPSSPARTRLANPSRLVFTEPASSVPAVPVDHPLTVEYLTDWRDMALSVHPRALERTATLEQQLAAIGVNASMDRTAVHGLVVNQISEPGPDHTAIEALYGLIVSPDRKARWVTPRKAPATARPAVAWTARLGNPGQTAVRALYASHMNTTFMFPPAAPGFKPRSLGFVGSVSDDDRKEIVGLTSVYGLPMLRRLISNDQRAVPDDQKMVLDDPSGMVFRPQSSFTYIKNLPNEEGLMLAKPFDRFNLIMSRSATVDALWQGEPPAKHGADFPFSFNIERYQHETQDGRDVYVEVVYKGFLFPLGHRAALLKLTQREFHPHLKSDSSGEDPVAYLIQHLYIVCNRPTKTFPAYNQPFESRDFPAKTVELLTTKTVDLAVPAPTNGLETLGALKAKPGDAGSNVDRARLSMTGNGSLSESDRAGVFWPTALSNKSLISFEYRLDSSAVPARSPLLFVDNAAAHDPDAMAAVVDYYNNLTDTPGAEVSPLSLRTVDHRGASRTYAPEKADGANSFNTTAWELGVRGHLNGDPSLPGAWTYKVDGLMEGADQPPFYPLVHQASVNIQQVDRLTGNSGATIRVGFAPRYVQKGFDALNNPSEIFLETRGDKIHLDASGNSTSTGGVAKPGALLSAISRKYGPVGGKGPNPGSATTVAAFPLEEPRDYDSALSGKFDPLEYFGAALQEANLLGIISLKDILRAVLMDAAPQLVEEAQYAASELAGAAMQACQPLHDAAVAVLGVATTVANKLTAGLTPVAGPDALTQLYPALATALAAVTASATKIRDATANCAAVTGIDDVYRMTSTLINQVKRLLAALKAFSGNPLPSGLVAQIDDLLAKWKTITAVIADPKQALLDPFVSDAKVTIGGVVKDAVVERVCAAARGNGAFEFVFGRLAFPGAATELRLDGSTILPVPTNVTDTAGFAPSKLASPDLQAKACMHMLRNPRDALPGLKDALFAEVLGEVLARAIETGKRLGAGLNSDFKTVASNGDLKRQLTWSARVLAERIAEILKCEETIADAGTFILAAYDMVEALQAAMTTAIANASAIDDPKKLTPPDAAVQAAIASRVKQLVDELNTEAAAAQTELKIQSALADAALKKSDNNQYYDAVSRRDECVRRMNAIKQIVIYDKSKLVAKIGAAAGDVLALAGKQLEVDATLYAQDQAAMLTHRATTIMVNWLDTACALLTSSVSSSKMVSASADIVKFLVVAQTLAVDFCKDRARAQHLLVDVDAALRSVHDKLGAAVDPRNPDALAMDLYRALGLLSVSVQQLKAVVDDGNRLCDAIGATAAGPIKLVKPSDFYTRNADLTRFLDPVGRAVISRQRALESTVTAMSRLGEAMRATALAGTKYGEVRTALSQAKDVLVAVAGATSAVAGISDPAVKATIEGFLSAEMQGELHWKDLCDVATALQGGSGYISFAYDSDKNTFSVSADGALNFAEAERRFCGAVLQAAFSGTEFEAELEDAARDAARVVVDAAAVADGAVLDALSWLIQEIAAGGNLQALGQILARGIGDDLKAAHDVIQAERDTYIAPLASDLAAAKPADVILAGLRQLAVRWSANGPAVLAVIPLVQRIVNAVTTGNLKTLIDVDDVIAQLEDELRSFVPTRFNLSYDFKSSLPDYPSDDPIFLMDRASDLRELGLDDLELHSRITIDVASGHREVSATGKLQPFKIHLLGGGMDLVTLMFSGAKFEASPGQPPSLKVAFDTFELGSALQFLSALEELLSGGSDDDDNGFYYKFHFGPPGIEVGYRYNYPFLSLVAINIQNIGMAVSAMLPLDDRQAEFRFSFASREKPFLISGTEYPIGGGGFVGVRSNAKGVIAFEVQLEFGAVLVFKFGPLEGNGRLTAGIYLLSYAGGSRRLEGFVHAVGEGHIACFGLSFLIEIRTVQDGSAMTGSSTYAFSFKVGFFEVGYSVTASHSTQGGSKKDTSIGARRHLALDGPANIDDCAPGGPRIRHLGPSRTKQWVEYSRYFQD